MADDEAKFDVRVRERHLTAGILKESEIAKHLDGLKDVADQAVSVVSKQPALQLESDRDIVIVRTSGVRPPPTPPRLDDDLESTPIDDEEDDDLDDDDDDEDEETVVKKAPVIEKPVVAEKPAPAPAEASDEDAEDEKEEKEKESEEGEKKVDDDWGESTT